jgi:hypothetical protein
MIPGEVGVGTILTFLGGIASKIVYDEINRWRQGRIEDREQKIKWYDELRRLVIEVKLIAKNRRSKLEIAEEDYRRAMEEGWDEVLSDEYVDKIQDVLDSEGGSSGTADKVVYEVSKERVDEVKEEIQMDMKLFETRLREHIAKFSEDVDDDILQGAGELTKRMAAVSMVGRIGEDYEQGIQSIADDVIEGCSDAIEELE